MNCNIHAIDPKNIGDMYSSPLNYFHFPVEIKRVNILDSSPIQKSDLTILGGGGLLHFEKFHAIACQPNARLVSWGIGHNTHGASRTVRWPASMGKFILHGVRDFGLGIHWVPCASCMHSAFDEKYKIENDIVIYNHQHFSTGIKGFPTMSNDSTSFTSVIRFLGSAETVVTSTYHGAYWATLLGRKVVVVNPFSTKFFYFKHMPVIAETSNWRQAMAIAKSYPCAVDECRDVNKRHFANILKLI